MILRLLTWHGIAGIAASMGLAALLAMQWVQTRHWRARSAELEVLYRQEQASLAATIANARAAADSARAADRANADRVIAEQRAITERTHDDYETRVAAARAHAERLRLASQAAADLRAGGTASMPGVPTTAGSAAQAANEGRLPPADALIATEQAIQLDELIKWVRRQAAVDNNAPAAANLPRD